VCVRPVLAVPLMKLTQVIDQENGPWVRLQKLATLENIQTESASKNDPKPDTTAKPKTYAKEDLKPGAKLTLTQAARHSDGCESYRGLWPVRDAAELEVGWMFLGPCRRVALFTDRLKILAY